LTQHGSLIPDEEVVGTFGAAVQLHMAGLVHVVGGEVASGRIIRNRLDLARQLGPR
jgi:hypothetical protein